MQVDHDTTTPAAASNAPTSDVATSDPATPGAYTPDDTATDATAPGTTWSESTADRSAGDVELRELFDRVRAGDQAAWNALVDRYNRLVWSVARSFRLSTADAADAVQMTWLRLVENLDRITEPERLASWLGTTVRRECLQHLRRSGRVQTAGAGTDLLDTVPDPSPPIETALLDDERDRALWLAMGMLGEKCQQLLRVLMASPPPPYSAVAAALDMPMGSIGPARQRCLAQLKKIITTDPDGGGIPSPRGAR